jgi:predicted Zn-dependent protease
MRPARIVIVLAASLFAMGQAGAQFGGILNRAQQAKDKVQDKAKPATDRADKAADTFQPWSASEEQSIGEAGAAKMVAMFGLVDNPAVTRYVNLVGQAVAQFASRALPYRFGVLDADIVGAYALPGGYIFITRGALGLMTNEAQLAGALAHEVTHCAERHLEREIRSKKTSAWAMQEAKDSSQTGATLTAHRADAMLGDLFNTGLSRDKEEAADEQGTLTATQAGYSAAGLMDFLTAMSRESSKPENQRMFGQLLSTHPAFPDRIARLRPIVEKAGGGGKALEARFQTFIGIK